MCTAINFKTSDHYFGRNLDLEYHYQEEVVITPRNYPFLYRESNALSNHYAMIGMATVVDGYPLYYDATNECGLSIAGLHFPGNAYYFPIDNNKKNIAPFELIPWILSRCKNITEVKNELRDTNIANINFNQEFTTSPLHWMVAYREKSLVIEQTKEGLKLYDNPAGVLTNNPIFPYHLNNLSLYKHLSIHDSCNNFSNDIELPSFSRGMGAIGLPGDWSSTSRFVRAAFVKLNAQSKPDELNSVSQFFHLLQAVAMPRGAIIIDDKPEITVYSSCCNTDKGIYYYNSYDNSEIVGIDLFRGDLDGTALQRFPLQMVDSLPIVN